MSRPPRGGHTVAFGSSARTACRRRVYRPRRLRSLSPVVGPRPSLRREGEGRAPAPWCLGPRMDPLSSLRARVVALATLACLAAAGCGDQPTPAEDRAAIRSALHRWQTAARDLD